MNARSVIIDNADTQIQYSSSWQVNGSPNEYKGTTSNTARKGESFTIKFVGTSVAVYGTVAAGTPPNSTYTLDGGDLFPFFAQRSTSIRYQQVFYSSPALPFMEHTLVGTCENENEGGEVVLDYFVIKTPLDFTTNTSSTPSICDSKPAPPTTIIVGSVLGSFTLLATIFASYLWHRGRNPKLMDVSTKSNTTYKPPLHAANSRPPIFTPNRSPRTSTAALSAINTRNSSSSQSSQDVLLFRLEPGQTEPQWHNYKDRPRLWLNTGI
ncbi:hypothetical protein PC9H_011679 [Pleurotus ostreatus]|uniref:Uncharacterized protein n=1 Tax=Pleurotus ostreatus TaxID=5322 RepID=A0A8H6ZJA2_PLEOS|nr:uncharacterized protein PC9H_011679 [Pleurotus ostreatus]KAF7421159.1 hypothetical protein PC9H_011679 [Pleurotus ostreatus]KAJ8690703.1 hypothetical protein PTI98_012109 [Pleurotus ostreatus]